MAMGLEKVWALDIGSLQLRQAELQDEGWGQENPPQLRASQPGSCHSVTEWSGSVT